MNHPFPFIYMHTSFFIKSDTLKATTYIATQIVSRDTFKELDLSNMYRRNFNAENVHRHNLTIGHVQKVAQAIQKLWLTLMREIQPSNSERKA